ncbi:DUF4256 domain-containing protein [Neolewinella lacunae]|uniref:DUF4256 domain-containing protein n=1 Tax=Neolewinella lacunae TaxID=1517758 RepID=A0A923T916_9BACT|nr:DUF4256 domain-containing protein [Neolewinella lacunae]MBC6996235.1 DUF4256 domain-containing protein [Neolewinella lacunae]MDN3634745.1 DUF4256 domain-containing protein [Neolewinella lacunae]
MPPKLSPQRSSELLQILRDRFAAHPHRHKSLSWDDVEARLQKQPAKLWSLNEMEITGGEPDVTGLDARSSEFVFTDCSTESPAGRRSLCYDRAGLESRKENRPANSAVDLARSMGTDLLTEAEYRELQALETFDTKTSSWLLTPKDMRELGGALFGDFRYGQVFIYHNGAQSYYAARGFRASLRV